MTAGIMRPGEAPRRILQKEFANHGVWDSRDGLPDAGWPGPKVFQEETCGDYETGMPFNFAYPVARRENASDSQNHSEWEVEVLS